MSEGWFRIKDSTQDVFVMSGMVKRFAIASARKALRIVEPLTLGSGVILGFAAGDLVLAMLMTGSIRSDGVGLAYGVYSWVSRKFWLYVRL